ncbi:MAG: DUF5025 domain-containing protein [Bacteroidota bacterium]
MCKNLKIKLLGLGFVISVLGCDKKDEVKQEPIRLNSFSMNLNDQLWEPSFIDNDTCFSTFQCEYFKVDDNIFYSIKAYKDSQSRTNYTSENIFRLQIKGVDSTGVYEVSEPFESFNSYAYFIINESGNQKVYENSVTKITSVVTIEEIIPIDFSELIGIRGSFSGILYNKVNPNDSIVIDNCKFTFKRTNWYDFSQCDE